MSKILRQLLIGLGFAGAVWIVPLQAQDFSKFAFNMGGGITTPLNPTGRYAGVSGNFVLAAGYNINKSNAIIGEFMYSGLPSNVSVLQPVKVPTSSISLYSLTVNYRHQFDRISGSPFGVYIMGGGGWYQRYITIDKTYTVPAAFPVLRIGLGTDIAARTDTSIPRPSRKKASAPGALIPESDSQSGSLIRI